MPDVPRRERDGAVFPPRSLIPPARRPSIVPAGLAAVLGGLVLIGGLQQSVPPDGRPSAAALATMTAPSAEPSAAAPTIDPRAVEPSSASGDVLRLDATPGGRHLFVHGEVFSLRVSVVIVSIRESEGQTLETRTLVMPGGSTAFRIGSVNRFEVRFDLPDPQRSPSVIVQASGYDAADDRIVSERVRVVIAEG